MKKIVVLILYFIFITILNIIFLNINVSFNDYCNLLFLNIETFQNYGLSIWNVQYIISFYLLFIMIENFNISYFNENMSFLSLILYRTGRKNTLKRTLKNILFNLIKYYIALNILIIICSFFMKLLTFNIETVYSLITINIYLVKYFLLMFLLIFKNFIDSLSNNFSTNIVKLNVLLLILIFVDLFLHTNLITFSSNSILELLYLLFYFIIAIIYYYFKVIRGGKNDRS